jgi:hypothetical protein
MFNKQILFVSTRKESVISLKMAITPEHVAEINIKIRNMLNSAFVSTGSRVCHWISQCKKCSVWKRINNLQESDIFLANIEKGAATDKSWKSRESINIISLVGEIGSFAPQMFTQP